MLCGQPSCNHLICVSAQLLKKPIFGKCLYTYVRGPSKRAREANTFRTINLLLESVLIVVRDPLVSTPREVLDGCFIAMDDLNIGIDRQDLLNLI